MIGETMQIPAEMAQILIYRVVYFVAMACFGSMIILAFRVRYDYHNAIYWLLGTTGVLCFVFSLGGENFTWPLPGLIWLVGILTLTFMLGLLLGWLLPFDSDVLVRKPLG